MAPLWCALERRYERCAWVDRMHTGHVHYLVSHFDEDSAVRDSSYDCSCCTVARYASCNVAVSAPGCECTSSAFAASVTMGAFLRAGWRAPRCAAILAARGCTVGKLVLEDWAGPTAGDAALLLLAPRLAVYAVRVGWAALGAALSGSGSTPRTQLDVRVAK